VATLFVILALLFGGLVLLGAWLAWLAWHRSPVGVARAAALEELSVVLVELGKGLGWFTALDRALDSACDTYAAERRAARLREMPIEGIKSYTEVRVRWSALRAAGITTVHDASRWSAGQLQNIEGVGSTSAGAVAGAVARARREIEREMVAVPTDVDSSTTRAVVLAARHVLIGQRASAERREAEATQARLRATERAVREGASLFAWLLRPYDHNDMLVTCAAARAEVLASPESARGGTLATSVSTAHALMRNPVGARDLEDDLRTRYGVYSALIDARLNHRTRDADARLPSRASGGLPAEIAGLVEAQDLEISHLKATLRPYQVFGAKYVVRQSRTILGDEMGLGKTLQVIAAMVHARQRDGASHFLVVAPGSVVPNWQRELARFSDLSVAPLRGTPGERQARLDDWRKRGGVAVASFETLTLLAVDGVGLDHLVVDEAHFVKNPRAKRTQAVQRLLDDAKRVTLLTGTPMENRPGEFIHLVGMVAPDRAAELRRHDAGVHALSLSNHAFRDAVAPVYLRRNQADVLTELPERIEVEEWVDLSAADLLAYKASAGQGAMMTLRWSVTVGAGPGSAKMERLRELVEGHAEDDRKILVFSFFTRVLDLAESVLGASFRIDGALATEKRQAVIDAFTSAPGGAVLLAQIDVGGVGLNIQAASVVILMEPQLKPSTESQAIARAHRMGQSRVVMVHRLLARESIDERICALLRQKTASFEAYARGSSLKDASPMAQAVDATPALEAELARLRSA